MFKLTSWKAKFGIIWTGQAVSLLGSCAAQFALIWWLTITTNSAEILSLAGLAAFLPHAFLGLFAGVWVDRLNRKLVMIVADMFVALMACVLLISFSAGEPELWLILTILFFRAIGGVFHSPAIQATMPLLLPPDMITKGAGWSQMMQSASITLGPVMGAALMAGGNIRIALMLDIIGAVIACISIAILDIPNPERSNEKPNIWRELKEGLQALVANKPLFYISMPTMVSMIVYLPISMLYPLMISSHFGGTAWHSSASEVAFGIGMIVSSAIVGIFGSRNKFYMISASLLALGGCIAVSGLLPPSAVWVFIVFSGLTGLTANFMSVPFFGYMQETTDPAVLGRVTSLVFAGMSLASPIGLFIAGPAADAIGISSWFALCGVLIALTALCSFVVAKRYPPLKPFAAAAEEAG